MNARKGVTQSALLVVAVLGPIFYLAGLLARGLTLLQASFFRLGLTYVALAVSAASAAYLLFRRGHTALRAVAGVALVVNLVSVGLAGSRWMQEMQLRFVEGALVPIEPIKVGILVAPLDETAGSREESRTIERILADMIRRDGLSEYVAVRHVTPVSSADQARRLGDKMRANVVIWKGRESHAQYVADYYLTVIGANETAIALDPVPLLTVLATHGTYTIPSREIVMEGQVPTIASRAVAPTAAGLGYMAIGRPMDAATQFQAALEAPDLDDETRAMIQCHFATAMLLLGRDDLAGQEYTASSEIAPNARAFVGLGNVAIARRDWTMAMQHFRQAIRLDPYDPAAYCGLGVLYSRERNVAQAMSAFQRAVALSPEESVPYAMLGMGYELTGDATRARDAYRVSERYAGANAGLHVAVAERADLIMRNPPTAVPTATPLPLPTPTPVPVDALYYVQKDDTLSSIAWEFGVSVEDLLKVNNIVHEDAIFIGQELIIPEKDE